MHAFRSNPTVTPYLSLRWKALIGLSIVLVAVNTSLALFSYAQLTNQVEQSQLQARALQAKQLAALLDDRYQQMSRLANVVPLLIPQRQDETLEQHLRRALNTNGVMLDLEWDIRSVHWIRPDGWTELLWPPEAATLPPQLAAQIEREPDRTARMLACGNDCRQFLAAPLLWQGESSGALVLGRSVADALLAFNTLTGAEVAIIASADAVASASEPTEFKAITHSASTRALFEQTLAKHGEETASDSAPMAMTTDMVIPASALLGAGQQWYEVFRLVDLALGIDALVLNDVTAQREAINATTRLSLLIGAVGLLLSEALLFLIMRTPLARLRRLADLLPLLADKKFTELQQRLPSARGAAMLQDEMDLMIEAARTLSGRMNAMERDREEARRELVWLADHDPLTKLLNRRRFDQELTQSVENAKRIQRNGALLFVDLDQFKDVNDTSGHHVGDGLLLRIAEQLTEGIAEKGIIGRLGGDEFAVLLSDANPEQAIGMAKEAQRRVQEVVVQTQDWRHQVTASIGIVLFPEHGTNPQQLMTDADLAMYQAKEKGRGRWHLFSPEDTGRERANARVIWAGRIAEAARNNRFELHLQPILEIGTGRIWRAEALIRMRNPDGKLVPPDSFIPIAEETGQIDDIDHWVLTDAIEQMAHRDDLNLSVNLSANAMQDPLLRPYIERLLGTHQVEPSRLTLEITETIAIRSLKSARRLMQEIRAIGCHFALDDFGSGFASYAYLRQLPFDDVKIDGAFIRNITCSNEDRIFVSAVTEMAHGMGKKIIAEFVENAQIIEVLKDIGVDFAQGYHVGKPEPSPNHTRSPSARS